jgi:energy-coupling factor transporter ATP-binding protein EcfA2
MIRVDNVSFHYGSVHALQEVTQEFASGDFVSIIGRNGSGKTTLARCMAGFLRPQTGTIHIDGQQIHRLRPRERVQVIGYVFQNPDHQIFRETVEDEVLFGLGNVGVRGEEAQRRVTHVLQRLELDGKRDAHPFRLARGDRQRLAIAAVAVLQPKVLVVDEPTTGQDPVRAREIMDILKDMNRQSGTTVIVVTHAMDLVAEYTARIVALSSGRIVLQGPSREVFRRAADSDKPPIALPPIVRLGIRLGLDPLPLTVDEFVARQ